MPLDIVIAVIIVFSMALGFRQGFIWSFLHMISWLLSVVFAFAFAPKAKVYLLENTGFYAVIQKALQDRLTEAVYFGGLAEAAGTAAADFLFTLMAFLLVIFAAKLAFYLIIKFLSKKSNGGVRGFIDGVLGLIMGLIKGLFIVSALLAIMIPVLSIWDKGLVPVIQGWLDSSYFTGTLYDNNILVLIVRDFLV